jgi:LysM repeat protein
MTSTIGIKLANGEFYSIIEENSNVKKRLILTTVHDNQQSMQIDLYKSFARSMADALYIGSIVVENIKKKPKGEPSIELILSSNSEGEITADAVDMDSTSSAEHQHLSVSLKSIDEDARDMELPDFELDSNESPPRGLYEKASHIKEKQERRKFPWVVLIIIGILILLLGLGLWFFVLRGQSKPTVQDTVIITPPVQPQPVLPPPIPEPAPAVPVPAEQNRPPRTEAAPVIEAPAVPSPAPGVRQTNRRNPPVASYNIPATIPRGGHPYKIRWGDTLWDISEAFYRNPWLYPRIARFNNIRNPDFIISGRTIRIPPKN